MKKLLLILSIFFLSTLSVQAQNVEIVKRPSGILSTKTVNGKQIQTELNYIYVNGEIAYCIEPGVALGTSYIKSEDFLSVGIGETLKKELELITYYGYEYEGHASPYYYAAVQEYIWEKMGAKNISFSQNGNIIDVKPYKVEILRLFLRHETLPSFASKKFEMHVGDTLELKDTNEALEHFTTADQNVKIKGNTLFISGEEEGLKKISFTQKKKQGKSLVYFSNSNQNVATFTLDDVYTKKFDLEIDAKVKRGNLILQKVDYETGAFLEGAEFYLYNEKGIVGKGKTDKNGTLTFENLIYGKYKIVEETAPKGYIKEEKVEEISLKEDKKVVKLTNVRHNMPITSDIDEKYRHLSFLFSSLGIIFLNVSKKII